MATNYVTNFTVEGESIYVKDAELTDAVSELETTLDSKIEDAVDELDTKIDRTIMKGTMQTSLLYRDFQEDDDIYTCQSIAVVGTYHIVIYTNSDDTVNYVFKYDSSTGATVSKTVLNLGHCNGATYDATNGVVLIATGNSEYGICTFNPSTMTIVSTNIISTLASVNNIAYDTITGNIYCYLKYEVSGFVLVSLYTISSSDYSITSTNSFEMNTPITAYSATGSYYANVFQDCCAYNGYIGIIMWSPNQIMFYDPSLSTPTCVATIDLATTVGYSGYQGEIESAEINSSGGIYLLINSPMGIYSRAIVAYGNILTGYNIGGNISRSEAPLSRYVVCDAEANTYGYADGSAEYPFRFVQEAVELAMVTPAINIICTFASDGNYGDVSLRGSVSSFRINGSYNEDVSSVVIGDLRAEGNVGAYINDIIFTWTYNLSDYGLYVQDLANIGLYNCSIKVPTKANGYMGYIDGNGNLTLATCIFNYNPTSYGCIESHTRGNLEIFNPILSYTTIAYSYFYVADNAKFTQNSSGVFLSSKCDTLGILKGSATRILSNLSVSGDTSFDLTTYNKWTDRYNLIVLRIGTSEGETDVTLYGPFSSQKVDVVSFNYYVSGVLYVFSFKTSITASNVLNITNVERFDISSSGIVTYTDDSFVINYIDGYCF